MTLLIVTIIIFLIINALPSLSIDFIFDVPSRRMRDSGIWPTIVGTFYLVIISLLNSAPVGVLAAVYLNEYAKDN